MKAFKNVVATLAAVLLMLAAPALAQPSGPSLQAIKDRGSLRVGVTQAPPWFSKDPRSGSWTGLGVAMGAQMAADLGVEAEMVEVTWGTAVAALQADKIDIMLMYSNTPERAAVVDFPERPILYISQGLLTISGVEASNWSDLNRPDFSIAVPQSTTMDTFLTEMLPEADIQRYQDNAAATAAFQAGRADGLSLYYPPLLAVQQKLADSTILVPQPTLTEPTSVAVRKQDDKAFVNWVDETLAGYYASGRTQAWYEETLTQMGIDPQAAPPVQVPE